MSKVVPISKAGDKTDLNSYRLISLLFEIAKVFERLLYNRVGSLSKSMMSHLPLNKFSPEHAVVDTVCLL